MTEPDPKLVDMMLAVRVAGLSVRELIDMDGDERRALVAAGWRLERERAELIADAIVRKLLSVSPATSTPPTARAPIDDAADRLRAALERHVSDAVED